MVEKIEPLDPLLWALPPESINTQEVTGTLNLSFDSGTIHGAAVTGNLRLNKPLIIPSQPDTLTIVEKLNQVIELLNELLEHDRALHALADQS